MKKKKNQRKDNLFIRYVILFIALIGWALIFNIFLRPVNFVTGGTTGISLILESIMGINFSTINYAISFVLIVLGLIFLDLREGISAIISSLVYPLLVDVTYVLTKGLVLGLDDKILIAIVGGILSGICGAMCYKVGLNSGGTSITNKIIHNKFKVNYATVSSIHSTLLVVVGGLVFGITNVLYALIYIYVGTYIQNKLILGSSVNKIVFVISDREDEIKDYVMNVLHHGITIFPVKGGFKERHKHVLMTTVPNRDYFKLTAGIKEVDKKAFFIINDAYEVNGIM